MSLASLLADYAVRDEFETRLGDLLTSARGSPGFESIDVGLNVDRLLTETRAVSEGAAPTVAGFEAIVRRFTRPVLLVQDDTAGSVPDHFENSAVIGAVVAAAKPVLDAALPSIGRIDLVDHRLDFAGTGWMVGTDLAVTNQHVASHFADRDAQGFRFLPRRGGGSERANLDWYHEYDRGARRAEVRVMEVVWMAEPDGVDLAILRLRTPAADEPPLPPPLTLMSSAEFKELRTDLSRPDAGGEGLPWVAVIGYPAQSPWNNPRDQQRIFDGIYGYKRLAPGQIMGVEDGSGVLHHDATTLGGNSGSAVVHLASGKVAGLHFQGIETRQNDAVAAPILTELLERHAR